METPRQSRSNSTEDSNLIPIIYPHEEEYDTLSSHIINELKSKGFNKVIFDFDETLTKYHSYRAENRAKLKLSENWFANHKLLKRILDEGKSQEINFYIVSKQDADIITDILRENGLLNNETNQPYFTEIDGADKVKKQSILNILSQEDTQKALYFDDDPEHIEHDKLKIVYGLLKTLAPKEPAHASRDLDGEAGMDYKKWQTTLECLQNNEYNLNRTQPFNFQSNSHTAIFPVLDIPSTQITPRLERIGIDSLTEKDQTHSVEERSPAKKLKISPLKRNLA